MTCRCLAQMQRHKEVETACRKALTTKSDSLPAAAQLRGLLHTFAAVLSCFEGSGPSRTAAATTLCFKPASVRKLVIQMHHAGPIAFGARHGAHFVEQQKWVMTQLATWCSWQNKVHQHH